jgi:hypothetical protein
LCIKSEQFESEIITLFDRTENSEQCGDFGKPAPPFSIKHKAESIKYKAKGGLGENEELPVEVLPEEPGHPTVEWQGKRGKETLRTFEETLPPELQTPDVVSQWRAWIVMRRTKDKSKTVDEGAAKFNLKELCQIEGDPAEIIEQSVAKKWDSFYPLKVKKPEYVNASGIHRNEQRATKSAYERRANYKHAEVLANSAEAEADARAIEQAFRQRDS